jgi:hypothetical protein
VLANLPDRLIEKPLGVFDEGALAGEAAQRAFGQELAPEEYLFDQAVDARFDGIQPNADDERPMDDFRR